MSIHVSEHDKDETTATDTSQDNSQVKYFDLNFLS